MFSRWNTSQICQQLFQQIGKLGKDNHRPTNFELCGRLQNGFVRNTNSKYPSTASIIEVVGGTCRKANRKDADEKSVAPA